MNLIAELKRRRVFRVAAAYVVFAWGLLQVADILLPAMSLPESTMRLLLVALTVLFPVVVLVAWLYQVSSDGAIGEDSVPTSRVKLVAVALATSLISGALALLWSASYWPVDQARNDDRPRVAVLPLKDMSPNADRAYFSDGIHEELISRLSELRAIAVPSRTSVERFRAGQSSIGEIAQQLRADYIIEGSVRHSAERVLITLQLIDCKTDDHIWVQDFDRELTMQNLFDIQRSVATNVAKLLRTQLSDSELDRMSAAPTKNIAAYDAVMRGIFHYRRYNQDDLRKSVEHLTRATQLDPEYASAWSGLANSYMLASTGYGWLEPKEAVPLAKEYGARALRLNPRHGGTISLIGDIAYWYDHDPVTGEARYKEGVAVDPYHVGNRLSYAYLLSTQSRHREAEQQLAFCFAEQPNEAAVYTNAAWRSIDARQYEQAIDRARAASLIDPNMQDAIWSQGYALLFLGRLEEAAALRMINDHPILHTLLLVKTGQLDQARAYVEDYERRAQRPADLVMQYAILEDADKAFEWLDVAIEERYRGTLLLGTWELFDPLRSDPRYDAALKRLGLR